jgi:predicted RND superfamily exporter protein
MGLFAVSAESANLVALELAKIGGLALLAVAAIVAVQFRSLKIVLLVFLPVTLGCLWTGALLKLLGTSIHFMNAAVFPMIIGIGIDDGIHTVHRYLLTKRAGKGAPGAAPEPLQVIRKTFSVSGTSVALTSFTTMLAFGSLACSQNRGLASLGALCLLGVGACLLASITVLPVTLALLEGRRGNSAGAGQRH